MNVNSLRPQLQPNQAQNLKQMQRLMMSPQMQQAIHFLQLPVQELSNEIELELEQNPVIELEHERDEEDETQPEELEKRVEFDDNNFEILQKLDDDFSDLFNESQSYIPQTQENQRVQTFLESSLEASPSLFEHLMNQATQTFHDQEQLKIAEEIIGNLDENGFFNGDLEEIAQISGYSLSKAKKVLRKIQTFDPCGVGAKNLQQALLMQLRGKGKRKTLAYKILSEYYTDLVYNHIPRIQKGIGCTSEEINHAVHEEIARLDRHPGVCYSKEKNVPIQADLSIRIEDDKSVVSVNQETVPEFHFNRKYLKMLEDKSLPLDAKEFIKSKLLSARWLIRSVHQRGETLERVGNALVKHQEDFFASPEGQLKPLTMKSVAAELDVHESTVARAVANKYVDTPRGLLPLRSFFTNEYAKDDGERISSATVRDLLRNLISREDKRKPLSDELLAEKIKAEGIPCARRTVAKYRAEMKLGNAHQRKRY